MNLSQIFKSLSEGTKLTNYLWASHKYVYVSGNLMKDECGNVKFCSFLEPEDWREWKDPTAVKFGELKIGDTFVFDGWQKMKVEEGTTLKRGSFNSIYTESSLKGTHSYCSDSLEVKRVI